MAMFGFGLGLGCGGGGSHLPDLTQTVTFAQGATAGQTLATLTKADGATVTISPNDGTLALVDDTGGTSFKIVTGVMDSTVGTTTYTLTQTSGPTSRRSTLTKVVTTGTGIPPYVVDSTYDEIHADLGVIWDASSQIQRPLTDWFDTSLSVLPATESLDLGGNRVSFSSGTLPQTNAGLRNEGTALAAPILSNPLSPATQSVNLTGGVTYTIGCWGPPNKFVTISGGAFDYPTPKTSTFTGSIAAGTSTLAISAVLDSYQGFIRKGSRIQFQTTGTASLASDGTLTVTAATKAILYPNCVITGGGINGSVVVQSQTSGTTGGAGVYACTNTNSQTIASTTLTFTYTDTVTSVGTAKGGTGSYTLANTYVTAVSSMTVSTSACRVTSSKVEQNKPMTFTPVATGSYTVTPDAALTAMQLETGTVLHTPSATSKAGAQLILKGRLATLMAAATTNQTGLIDIEDFGPETGGYLFATNSTSQSNGLRRDSSGSKGVQLNSLVSNVPTTHMGPHIPVKASWSSGSSYSAIGLNGTAGKSVASNRSVFDRMGLTNNAGLATFGGHFLLKRLRMKAVQSTSTELNGVDATVDNPVGLSQFTRDLVGATFSYSSSIQPSLYNTANGTGLGGYILYDPKRGKRPVIFVFHGTSGHYLSWRKDGLMRLAAKGFTVVSLGMRNNAFLGVSDYINGPAPGYAAWSNATAYAVGDCVTYNSVKYACTQAHTNQTPTSTSYWSALPGDYPAWNSGTTYVIGDAVTYQSVPYWCKSGNTNQVPPNATYWTSVAGNYNDSNNLEVQDAADGIRFILNHATYGQFCDKGNVTTYGGSGGGATVWGLAARFPDIANVHVSAFGWTDAGGLHWPFGGTIGIGNRATGAANAAIDDPAVNGNNYAVVGTNSDRYRMRKFVESVPKNCRWVGRMFFTSDPADQQVDVANLRQMATALTAAGRTNWDYQETNLLDANDSPYYYPHEDPTLTRMAVFWEGTWVRAALGYQYRRRLMEKVGANAWVPGWLESERGWRIQLGTLQSGIYSGASFAATASLDAWDLTKGTFTLTPQQPSTGVPYTITYNGRTATGTLTAGANTITLP